MKLPVIYIFKKGRLKHYCRIKDIDYVKGDGNYSGFYFTDGKLLTETGNIGWHWNRLMAVDFLMRIHRSCIVNLKAIKEFDANGRVVLKSGTELHCALELVAELKKRYTIIGI